MVKNWILFSDVDQISELFESVSKTKIDVIWLCYVIVEVKVCILYSVLFNAH